MSASPDPWREAVAKAARLARDKLPADQTEVIDAAEQLVLAEAVTLHDQGHATVQSQHDDDIAYAVHGQRCPCPASTYNPRQRCKHVLAVLIARKAREEESTPSAAETRSPESSTDPETLGIDPRWIRTIHQSKHVLYAGLLDMAKQQGLVSLTVTFLHVSPELVTAQATATFADGRTFTECGDATPGNVTPQVAKHFARVALTRAKARCLRDALNLGALVAAEELG